MRDEHPGETECVHETNLITPAMGQTSPAPSTPPPMHLLQHTHIYIYPPPPPPLSSVCTPVLQVYCEQVEARRCNGGTRPSVTLTAVKMHRPCCIKEPPQHLTPHFHTKGIGGHLLLSCSHFLQPSTRFPAFKATITSLHCLIPC